jgi:hypothetical protein
MQRARELGLVINGGSTEKLGQIIQDDLAKFGKIVVDAKIPKE